MLVAVALLPRFALAERVPVPERTGIVQTEQEVPEACATDTRVFLSVPHLKQEPNLCVPTSAAMVLSYFGDPHSPRELKVLSRGNRFDPSARFDDFTITWYRDLDRGLRTLGYSWRAQRFPNTARGFQQGLEAMRASLRKKNPVLVDVALYGTHTFVIAGFDDAAKRVFIRDPNLPTPGLRILTYEQLESIWNGLRYDLDARPSLFTQRKRD